MAPFQFLHGPLEAFDGCGLECLKCEQVSQIKTMELMPLMLKRERERETKVYHIHKTFIITMNGTVCTCPLPRPTATPRNSIHGKIPYKLRNIGRA